MGTKIILNYKFTPFHFKSVKLRSDSYVCKEKPFIVLEKLIQKHNISSYRDFPVSKKNTCVKISCEDVKADNYMIKSMREIFNGSNSDLFINYSLSISRWKECLTTSKSIDDFYSDFPFLKDDKPPKHSIFSEAFVGSLIQNNLVKIHKNSQGAVESVYNYLDNRATHQNPLLEQKLCRILEIASALYEKEVDTHFLKKINLRIPEIGSVRLILNSYS